MATNDTSPTAESTMTDATATDGSGADGIGSAVAAIRAAINAAQDAEAGDRDDHIKTALGEVLWLRATGEARTTELQEQLTNAVVAPTEEEPYFLNRAEDALESLVDELDAAETVPTTPAEVEAAFDAVPWIDEPTADERERARMRFPDTVVAESGPVPHFQHDEVVEVDVEVPQWALATAADQLAERMQSDDVDRLDAVGFLHDCIHSKEHYVTPSGEDAIDAVLKAAEAIVNENPR